MPSSITSAAGTACLAPVAIAAAAAKEEREPFKALGAATSFNMQVGVRQVSWGRAARESTHSV
jgi:hypothetical protein